MNIFKAIKNALSPRGENRDEARLKTGYNGGMEDEHLDQPGALIDDRPAEAKAKDYRFEEIVASVAPVQWRKKANDEIRRFPIFDQGRSGSCVAQTGKKQIGVYTFLKTGAFFPVSATHLYQRRSNKPGGGMIGINAYEIMQKGVAPAVFAADERMSDAEMDALRVPAFAEHVGKAFSIGNYMVVPTKDIDLIASIIQETGKAVMVWFYFEHNEWTERPRVRNQNLDLYAGATARHSVAAVDFTLTEDGKKALVIDDSWGPSAGNGAGQRVIDEDFFRARNWFAAHFMNFAFEEQGVPGKPQHTFLRDLEFSAVVNNDPEVVALQDCLKWEGLFPANVESSGYFGQITKKAVEGFQQKYDIARKGDAGFGRVGPKTRAKLNQIYWQ